MKHSSVIAALLGSSAALATPGLHRRTATSSSSRPASHRLLRTLPAGTLSPSTLLASSSEVTTTSGAGESTKGGAVLPGIDVTSVSGTFFVPTPEMPTSGPTGGNVVGLYGASFWLGIDGVSSCTQASLRAGVDIFWDQRMQQAVAWYQWYPSPATDFANFTVAPGDAVRITAKTEGNTGGSVSVNNLGGAMRFARGGYAAKGQSATQTFTSQSALLCQSEAVFVIEDFPLLDSPNFPVALVNFSSITYGDLEVETGTGVVTGATGAQILNINLQAQGGQLTDCQLVGAGDVKCDRVVLP